MVATRYATFLRGVNVGGVNLKMADVAKAFEAAGFCSVRTVLASGNVLFDSKAGVEAVRRKAAISAAYPFEREVTGHHSYVAFMTDEQVLDELAALADGAGPEEKIQRYESSTTTRNLRTLAKVLG